ncbi:MAG: flavin reductase family protein [Acidobacteriota bacterium]|nr:flavin reductase family protein [Acidobacteriota bacterium]
MAIDNDEFRAALSRFASGITVVTTKDAEGRLHGITVSAFCSVSLDPPLILICVEKTTGSHYAIEQSGIFVVNVLNASQSELSERFASTLPDKFDDIDFVMGINGIPVLADSLANLECRLKNTCDGGDHTIFVGEVERAMIRDGDPLVYFHGDYRVVVD